MLGIAPHLLNDDRLGRALDATAPELAQITGSVGAAAICAFGIDTAQLHWDLTSITVHGAYEHSTPGFPALKPGRAKDGSVGLTQVQAGLAVSGDGAIPVFRHAYDGGAAEVTQVLAAMTALKIMARSPGFLLVGDSKLLIERRGHPLTDDHLLAITSGTSPSLPASPDASPMTCDFRLENAHRAGAAAAGGVGLLAQDVCGAGPVPGQGTGALGGCGCRGQ